MFTKRKVDTSHYSLYSMTNTLTLVTTNFERAINEKRKGYLFPPPGLDFFFFKSFFLLKGTVFIQVCIHLPNIPRNLFFAVMGGEKTDVQPLDMMTEIYSAP